MRRGMNMATRIGAGFQPSITIAPLGRLLRRLQSSSPPYFSGSGNNIGKLFSSPKDGVLCRALEWTREQADPFNSLGFYALRKDVEDVAKRVEAMALVGLEQEEAILTDLEHRAAENNLWDDLVRAQETLLKLADSEENIALLKDLRFKAEDAKLIIELAEMGAVNAWLLNEAYKIVMDLDKTLNRYELSKLLSGPYDKEGACLTISAGTGSTDAQFCTCIASHLGEGRCT
eukprot:Gb_04252 [translate_table: standard]